MLRKTRLYLHTIRYLRPSQLYAGVRWRLRKSQRSRPAEVSEPLRNETRIKSALLQLGPDRSRKAVSRAEEVGRRHFRFLNVSTLLPVIDWQAEYINRLWTYNLHYFDYALDLAWAFNETGNRSYAETFVSLAQDWIRFTPRRTGDAWDPYPISLRTVNWLYSLVLFGDAVDTKPRRVILRSVVDQLRVLTNSVEWHILGNHVLKNLKALLIGSLFFEGEIAIRHRREREFWNELRKQVNEDGMHYEASPMYHAIVLGDVLEIADLVRSVGDEIPPDILACVRRMTQALARLSRANGAIRLLNDSAIGVAPSSEYLHALAETVLGRVDAEPPPRWSLTPTGYHGYRDPEGRLDLIIACRGPSPSFQPGHSHSDILSFELDVNGAPVIVDSGVHGYDGDPYREYVRSTRAHNTVVIAGKDQSEQWATFRFARRAKKVFGASRLDQGVYTFEGSYKPYHAKRTTHRRTIRVEPNGLRVIDAVTGSANRQVESFLHFHPDFVASVEDGRVIARKGATEIHVEFFGIDRVSIVRGQNFPVQGWYCEEFGKAVAQDVVVIRRDRNDGSEFGYRIAVSDHLGL